MWLLVPGTQICAYGSVLMAFWGTSGPTACIPMTKAGLMAVPRIVYFVGPHNRWQTTSQTQKARIADGFWKVEKAGKYSPLKPLLKHLSMNQNKQKNSKRNGNTRPPYLPPEKPVCQSRSNRTGSGTMDWFKLRKSLWKNVYCSPASLTSVQSTSCETPGWMNHKLESRFLEEITTSDMQMIPP